YRPVASDPIATAFAARSTSFVMDTRRLAYPPDGFSRMGPFGGGGPGREDGCGPAGRSPGPGRRPGGPDWAGFVRFAIGLLSSGRTTSIGLQRTTCQCDCERSGARY